MPSCQVRAAASPRFRNLRAILHDPDRLHSEDLVNKVVPKTAVVAKG